MVQKKLFTPVELGSISLEHRIAMPGISRSRASLPSEIPGALMVEYYFQRASEGGLIITEANAVSRDGTSFYGSPGLYSNEQVTGWRAVVDAVHAKGAKIVAQLFHAGRVSHADLNGGEAPVGPSELPFTANVLTPNGFTTASPNRALRLDEIPGILASFRKAAYRAMAAGFDGVEVYGANGNLLDQFLSDGSNQRKDGYGGPIENRARLLFEVLDEVVSVWGSERVGLRLSPFGTFNDVSDSDPENTYGYVASRLNRSSLAYLHIIEPRVRGSEDVGKNSKVTATPFMRNIYIGKIIAAGGFDPESAESIVASRVADMVAFGRHFISNPDLTDRIKQGFPLNRHDPETYYLGGARGYTDYPIQNEQPLVQQISAQIV